MSENDNNEVIDIEIEKEYTLDPNIKSLNPKLLKGHTRCLPAFAFYPKKCTLATGTHAASSEVIIWEVKPDQNTGFSFKQLKKLEYDFSDICVLMKWGDDVCISCGSNNQDLICFSVLPPYEIVKKIRMPTRSGRRHGNYLLDLENEPDQFLLLTYTSELFVISFTEGKSVRKVDVGLKIDYMKKMVPSVLNRDCLFVATDDSKCTIKLINHKENKLVQDYNEHKENITSIQTYVDEKNQEILLCGGNCHIIFFYNVKGLSEKEQKKENKKYRFLFRMVEIERQIYALYVLKNSYCCVGDSRGRFQLIDLRKRSDDGRRGVVFDDKVVNVLGGAIWGFQLIHEQEGKVSLMLGSEYGEGSLAYFQIFGLDFRKMRSKIEMEDFLERIQFLLYNQERFLFSGRERNQSVFIVKLKNVHLNAIKFLFL